MIAVTRHKSFILYAKNIKNQTKQTELNITTLKYL